MSMIKDLIRNHKQAVFFGNGFADDIDIRKKQTDEPLRVKGIFTHTGMVFSKSGDCFIGETCEISINKDDINIGRPQEGWFVDVYQDGEPVPYRIEAVFEDKTPGIYLLRCSVKNESGRIEHIRKNGGI